MKEILFIISMAIASSVKGQGFAELQLRSGPDLSKVIEAAKADQNRTKAFFGLLKLGSFYLDENKIPLCDSVLQIIEKEYTDIINQNVHWRTLSTSDYYQLLSSYYYVKNDNVKSKLFLEKARHLGSDVFSYTNNLYRLYIKEGKLDSAELYLKESFPRLAKDLDVHKLDINLLSKFELSFRNMCHLKIMQGDVNGLKFYLSKWLAIASRNLDNPAGIKTRRLKSLTPWKLIFLSKYFILTGHFEEAKRALELTSAKQTETELKLEYLRSWSQLHYSQNNIDSTVTYLNTVLSLHRENIKMFFPFFTEIERENYITELNDDYDLLLSVIAESPSQEEEHLTNIFEFQLFRKGLLLDITRNISKTASTVRNENALKLLRQIVDVNDTIAYITFKKTISFGEGKEQVLRSFNARKEAYEKKFLQLMQTESAKLFTEVSAQEISKKLPEESCLLEMIRFRKWTKDKNRIVSPTGISYAILKIPYTGKIDWALLSNGEELEGPYAKLYKNTIQGRMTDDRLYDIYWSKIFNVTSEYQKIFLSPDGIYNIINVNTLQQPFSKRFVLDEKTLINLTSPKDLLDVPKDIDLSNEALLLGYPQYSFSHAEDKPATFRGSIIESLESIKEEQFASLPATQEEVEIISEIIKSNGGKATILEGREATEQKLKSVRFPEILHLATHGFFIGSENNLINPLLKSGLVLAGVNNKETYEDSNEDGILTALEIASLDLKETRLVILSACETGLGDVKNGDGVYGLQRAFKMAEARFIILSMWKVDDEATMQLMKLFYSSLVQTNDVAISFETAQKELRSKYPDPYYWGAFKLFGY